MVRFEDCQYVDDQQSLKIFEDSKDGARSIHILHVQTPAIGGFALSWPSFNDIPFLSNWTSRVSRDFINSSSKELINSQCLLLQSPFHSSQKSTRLLPLLGQRLQSKELIWPSPFSIHGEFSFSKCYWEWLEDVLETNKPLLMKARIYDAVFASLFIYDKSLNLMRYFYEHWSPSTNTLYLPNGEESISLWDLNLLGGLPTIGMFYDEVIPSAKELLGRDKNGVFLPRSYRYLFHAYHRLCHKVDDHHVLNIDDWINFWFQGPARYSEPPVKDSHYSKRTCAPKKTFCPSGIIDRRLPRDKNWQTPFDLLGVKDRDLQEEIYLAAFLSCWLCKFALPRSPPHLIRPSIFKIASMMATGDVFCLAIPVLTSIYHGLHQISTSTNLKDVEACFPVHYIYGWLADKYDTHFTQKDRRKTKNMSCYGGLRMARFYKSDEVEKLFEEREFYLKYQIFPQREKLIIDDNSLREKFIDWAEYVISLRSGYLTSRYEDVFYIQPYSPHRFSRQFGFCQDVPRSFEGTIETPSLKKVLQFWNSLTKGGSQSKVIVSHQIPKEPFHATKDYVEWWSKEWSRAFSSSKRGPFDPPPDLFKSCRISKDVSHVQTIKPTVDGIKESCPTKLMIKQNAVRRTLKKISSEERSDESNPHNASIPLTGKRLREANIQHIFDEDVSDLESNSDHSSKRSKSREKESIPSVDLAFLDDLPNSSFFNGPPFDASFLSHNTLHSFFILLF